MSRKKDPIRRNSIAYIFLWLYEQFAFKRFYKHFQVVGSENIPLGKQWIFAPNHQNALMDALAIVNSCPVPTFFFARADIFKKKRQGNFLRSLKIMPIYRMRDGASELSKNEEIFDTARNILDHHIPICIMPEGNHGDKRRLRKLVKGIFRIAFKTQETLASKEGVKIVPVGLDYGHYTKFFQDLLVVIGQPIEVSDFIEEYQTNAPRGINALKKRLEEELKKVMIHIESEDYYNIYQDLRTYYNKQMRKKAGIVGKTHYDRFRADKIMIEALDETLKNDPEVIEDLSKLVRSYSNGLNSLNLRNWIFERSGFTTRKLIYKRIGLALSFPVFLYGFLNNYIAFTFPVGRTKNIKDAQFHSSIKFVLAMIAFPVMYALQTILVSILTGPAWIAWAYLLSLPATGYFALFWSIWYKRWKAGLKYRKMKKSRDAVILDLEKDYHSIQSKMDKIVDAYLNK